MKNLWRCAYMQRCLRAWGGGAICLRERAKLRLASMSLYGKIENVAGVCGDGISLLWTIWWEDHHFAFSIPLERISTKDISPENFKGASVDVTRDYFGPTRKIYVYSGVLCACPHFMDHTYILGNQFRKDPVWCTFSTAYHKLEEHRS